MSLRYVAGDALLVDGILSGQVTLYVVEDGREIHGWTVTVECPVRHEHSPRCLLPLARPRLLELKREEERSAVQTIVPIAWPEDQRILEETNE